MNTTYEPRENDVVRFGKGVHHYDIVMILDTGTLWLRSRSNRHSRWINRSDYGRLVLISRIED